MVSEEQVLEAVTALVKSNKAAKTVVEEAGVLSPPYPSDLVTVYVVRRAGGTERAGRMTTTGWAAYLTVGSSVSGDNARESLRRACAAIENKVIVVGLERSTPARFDNARAVTKDNGWHSGVVAYHFAI